MTASQPRSYFVRASLIPRWRPYEFRMLAFVFALAIVAIGAVGVKVDVNTIWIPEALLLACIVLDIAELDLVEEIYNHVDDTQTALEAGNDKQRIRYRSVDYKWSIAHSVLLVLVCTMLTSFVGVIQIEWRSTVMQLCISLLGWIIIVQIATRIPRRFVMNGLMYDYVWRAICAQLFALMITYHWHQNMSAMIVCATIRLLTHLIIDTCTIAYDSSVTARLHPVDALISCPFVLQMYYDHARNHYIEENINYIIDAVQLTCMPPDDSEVQYQRVRKIYIDNRRINVSQKTQQSMLAAPRMSFLNTRSSASYISAVPPDSLTEVIDLITLDVLKFLVDQHIRSMPTAKTSLVSLG